MAKMLKFLVSAAPALDKSPKAELSERMFPEKLLLIVMHLSVIFCQ